VKRSFTFGGGEYKATRQIRTKEDLPGRFVFTATRGDAPYLTKVIFREVDSPPEENL